MRYLRPTMWFTIFCCVSTGLVTFCFLNRVNKRTVDLAVHAAVHEVKKELHERHVTVMAQVTAKERELTKLRERLKLHEAVPAPNAPGPRRALKVGTPVPPEKPGKKKPKEGYELFEMSRPFTETAYNEMLRATDVVKIEPAGL
ncbi:MAG: hypothetical protein ABI745_00820 [Caldimonas sp.]